MGIHLELISNYFLIQKKTNDIRGTFTVDFVVQLKYTIWYTFDKKYLARIVINDRRDSRHLYVPTSCHEERRCWIYAKNTATLRQKWTFTVQIKYLNNILSGKWFPNKTSGPKSSLICLWKIWIHLTETMCD